MVVARRPDQSGSLRAALATALSDVDPADLRAVVAGRAAALTLIGIIIWWGWDYAQRGGVQSMAGLESMSMFWAYLAMPVGGLFCIVGILGNLVDPMRMELETAQ